MPNFKLSSGIKLALLIFGFVGFVSPVSAADSMKTGLVRTYHLGDIEDGPGGKPKKPAAMFRHLIFNFQNPLFHSKDTFVKTAALQIAHLQIEAQVAAGNMPSKADDMNAYENAIEAATQNIAVQLNVYFQAPLDGKDPKNGIVLDKFVKLYGGLFVGFNKGLAPQIGLPVPKMDGSPEKLATDVFTDAQRLFRIMLLVSRGFSNDLFAELRKHEPVFMIPGDNPKDPKLAAQKAAGVKLARPVERATYLVTRFQDISYGYAYNTDEYGTNWEPLAVKRQTPPYTNVIYSNAVVYFGKMTQFIGKAVKLMDYATGGYLSGVWDIEGTFMLGTKGTRVNEEKAYVHKITNRIQKMNAEAGELADRAESQQKVRDVVAWYVKEAMKNKAGETSVDFARDISRQAALGMVSDYFGFYPPDVNSQTQWSRNTQNSFFHNIFDDPWFNHVNMAAGEEMADYISQVFKPAYDAQLSLGRPATDTVSMMIKGHAKIPNVIKDAFEINDQRIMATTMGLLVGAGETTTMAANFALHEIMVEAAKRAKAGDKGAFWKDFITTAKMALAGDKAAKTKFDGYVWEGLRFGPVNPWTERMSDMNSGELTTYKENLLAGDGNGEEFTYQVEKGARVLFATQSAMFDPAMKLISGDQLPAEEQNKPWTFSTNRGSDNYIHLAFGYHRCLGDDVVLAMVPEVILQVVANVDGLDFQASLKSVDNPNNSNPIDRELMFSPQSVPVDPAFKQATGFPKDVLEGMRTPFPETFKLVYASKSEDVTRDQSPLEKAKEYFAAWVDNDKWGDKVAEVLTYLDENEALDDTGTYSKRVLDNGLARFDVEKYQAKEQALFDIEKTIMETTNKVRKSTCEALASDEFGDPATLDEICKFRTAYKAMNLCYFLQKVAGQKSPQHAFNKCFYEKGTDGKLRVADKGLRTKLINLLRTDGTIPGSDFYWMVYQQAAK